MNKLVKYIQDYRTENPSGWRKWVFGTVAVLAAIVVITVFTYLAVTRGKQLAALFHERDVLKERAKAHEADAKLSITESDKQQHLQAAAAAEEQVAVLAEQITVLQTEHQTNEDIINSIRNWNDVDRVVR